jgi:hypothetical protein
MPANPGGLVYGTIAVAALLAAETARRESYAKSVAAVAITLLLYWIARSYAEFTGQRLQKSQPFRITALAQAMVRELTVLIGAAIPLLVLLVWWAAGAGLSTAINAAIWTSALTILLIEVVSGLRARLSGRDLVLQTALGAVLGLLVTALRVVLH